jgi:hypothetical protein
MARTRFIVYIRYILLTIFYEASADQINGGPIKIKLEIKRSELREIERVRKRKRMRQLSPPLC